MSQSKPLDGTVENLLVSVAGITNAQNSFELFVPAQLTLKGEPIPQVLRWPSFSTRFSDTISFQRGLRSGQVADFTSTGRNDYGDVV